LAGFQRVHLKAGERRTLRFMVAARAMSVVDEQGRRVVPAGTVELWVGGGQPSQARPSAGAAARFAVTGSATIAPF
jgi:beta-glucosidase